MNLQTMAITDFQGHQMFRGQLYGQRLSESASFSHDVIFSSSSRIMKTLSYVPWCWLFSMKLLSCQQFVRRKLLNRSRTRGSWNFLWSKTPLPELALVQTASVQVGYHPGNIQPLTKRATAENEDLIKLIPACGLIDGTISMRYHQPKIASSRSGTMFTVKTFLSLLLAAGTAQIGESYLLHLQKNSTAQDRVSLVLLCKHKPSYFYSHLFRSNGPTRHWRVHPRSWAVQPRGEDTTWPVVQPALILFLGLGLFSSIRSSPENLLPDRAETRSSQVREAACLWSKVRFWILFGLKRKLISGIRSEVSLGEQQEERWGWKERRRNEGYKI